MELAHFFGKGMILQGIKGETSLWNSWFVIEGIDTSAR